MDDTYTRASRPDERLVLSEARFRAVVEGFGDPILIVDAYLLIRYVNAAFLTLFGHSRADVIGRPFDDLLPPEEREPLAALADHRPGAPLRLEHRLRRRDGGEEVVETSANCLADPSGHDTTILHVRVVTERKRAEETLRASEQRYRRLVENSHDLIQSVTPDGRLSFVNRAWLDTLGYAEADLPALSFWDIVHPDTRPACERELAALWQGRETGFLSLTLIAADGAPVDVEGVAVAQLQGEGAASASAFLRNVTEQRRSERVRAVRLAISRIIAESPDSATGMAEALEAIAANVGWQLAELWWPDDAGSRLAMQACWHVPGDHRLAAFVEASRAVTVPMGEGPAGQAWAAGEVVWQPDLRAPQAFGRAALGARAGLRMAVAIPVVQGAEVRGVLLFLTRSTRPPDARIASVLADLGRQLGQFAARKQVEAALEAERASLTLRVKERTAELISANTELERAVRAKDEFLATMSHELRTPLNTILALAETLLEQIRGPLNERQESWVRGIDASGRHLLALINDILDLSKVEAGRLELAVERMVIAEVCQASLAFVKELALRKRLRLAFQLNDQLAELEADPRRLKQMLVNLLSNAVKFTPPDGQVSLEVEVRQDPGTIRFAVRDSGVGMTPEGMAKLFQPFTQLDSSLHRHHEGTGLGLALVRRLTELHGGSVSVESEVGVGSVFTITLPYRAPAKPAGEPAGADVADSYLPRLALVIDDSETAAEQLAGYLRSMNLEVVIEPSGSQALERARRLLPNVIVLDLFLPEQSGWEILAQLKGDAGTQAIPVIIASVVDEQAKGLAAGAAAYLVKPLSREAVRAALLSVVKREAERPALAAPAATHTTSARILLAEDNESTIQVIGDYLEANGYEVAVARNGREALERVDVVLPDLILMDIQMPEVDGLEVTRRLRASATFATTPIIALTALAMPGDRERCLAAGATTYMTKPVGLKRLAQTIEQLLHT